MRDMFRKKSQVLGNAVIGNGDSDTLPEFQQQADALFKLLEESDRKDPVVIKGLPFGGWCKRLKGSLESLLVLLKNEGEMLSESGESDHAGPCLQHMLNSKLLDTLSKVCLTDKPKGARLCWLRTFASMLKEVRQPLVIHEGIVTALNQLIQSLHTDDLRKVKDLGNDMEIYVETLSYVVKRVVDDPSLLSLFFGKDEGEAEERFPVFEALLPFMHQAGIVGDRARTSLLLCMELSKSHKSMSKFILEQTTFCQTVAGGLCGMYYSLPTKLPGDSKKSWRLNRTSLPQLGEFLSSLGFCDSVIHAAASSISRRVLKLVYDAFLLPVFCPAFHQETPQEASASTAYLEICLRSITTPELMKAFVCFVVHSSSNSVNTLQLITRRIMSKGVLCLVTLRLLLTLTDLNSEDFMLEFCMRDLMTDARFQGVDPRKHSGGSDNSDRKREDAVKMTHIVHGTNAKKFLSVRKSSPQSVTGVGFREYLMDARRGVTNCAEACKVWKHAYDQPLELEPKQEQPLQQSKAEEPSVQESDGLSGGGFWQAAGRLKTKLTTKKPKQQEIVKPTESRVVLFEVLCSKVRKMLHHPLHVNLLLSALVVRLAQFPHPLLRHYFLNTRLAYPDNCGFFSILEDVANEAIAAETQFPQLREKIQQLRDNFATSTDSSEQEKAAALSGGFVLSTTVFSKSPSEGSNSRPGSGLGFDKGSGSQDSSVANSPGASPRASPRTFRKLFRSRKSADPKEGSGESFSLPADPFTSVSEVADAQQTDIDPALKKQNAANSKRERRTALATLIYEEMLKELAAVSLEQGLADISPL